MGQAIPGLAGVLANTYMGVAKKAFPLNTPLLQQMQQQYYTTVNTTFPNQLYIPPMETHKTTPSPCHCGNCPTSRDFNRDVFKVKQTALCWLDAQVERVRAHGRQWLSGRHSVEVDGLALADRQAKAPNYKKYPPPVSDGIPTRTVRVLPNGDYLWAPDVDTLQFTNCTVNGTT